MTRSPATKSTNVGTLPWALSKTIPFVFTKRSASSGDDVRTAGVSFGLIVFLQGNQVSFNSGWRLVRFTAYVTVMFDVTRRDPEEQNTRVDPNSFRRKLNMDVRGPDECTPEASLVQGFS